MEERMIQPLRPKEGTQIPVSVDGRYVASEDYVLREIAGESILVCVGDNETLGNSMLSLNETYTFLWQLYQEPMTLSEVLEKAHEEYDDPDGVMERHIMSFLWQSLQFGLLVEA